MLAVPSALAEVADSLVTGAREVECGVSDLHPASAPALIRTTTITTTLRITPVAVVGTYSISPEYRGLDLVSREEGNPVDRHVPIVGITVHYRVTTRINFHQTISGVQHTHPVS